MRMSAMAVSMTWICFILRPGETGLSSIHRRGFRPECDSGSTG